MDKRYYSALELLKIATQHAYSADYLLRTNTEEYFDGKEVRDSLLPISSLMYTAFQLTFRAYLLHTHRSVRQNKTLVELLEMNLGLEFSAQDLQLFKTLSRQLGFRKGVDYELWETREQCLIFCTEILDLYERLQELMPLELQQDYLQ